MIIKITNLVQEALANHDLNYELSGDEQSKNLLIPTADAMLFVNVRESDVYVSGMYKQRIPSNQGPRLRVLCKEVSNIASYSYSITSGRVMCIKRISLDEIINDSDVVYRELVGISNRLADFYATNTEVPTSGRLSSKNMSPAGLKRRFEAVSASITETLKELEDLKDELESYKDLLEEKAEAARDRADSYSTWNDRAEDKASELEDKFSDIEGFYDEIDSAYDELRSAEMTLSTAVMGAYVLD